MTKIKKIASVILIGLLIAMMGQPGLASTGKVNINTATKSELLTLKYVGDKIAEKIMEYRKAHPFEKAEDIMNVKGIGPKVFESNKDLIVVKDE